MSGQTFAKLLLCNYSLVVGLVSAQSSAPLIDYTHQVNTVFAEKCFACHSQEKRSGGLSLYTYDDAMNGGRSGAAIRPGKAADSLLMQRVQGEMQPRMPLGGPALSADELTAIQTWIDQGARRTPTSAAAKPKWEAPLELTHPTVPAVVWSDWSSPLDRFTAAYLVANKIPKPELVSDALFARRVYLDLWGLLPTPAELQRFEKDRSPRKRQKLVETLLANQDRYGENWISFWNDLLRNDEGINYFAESASRKSISKWLLGALKENLPYDQFVYQLLNPTTPTQPEGFLIGVNWRGTVSASQTAAMQAAQNTAQIFLGINLKCNSCHDSFVSKWKLKDAYSLAGYFSSEDKLQLYRCDVAQEKYAEAAFLYPALDRAPASSKMADRRAAAAEIFTDPRNGRLSRTLVNRLWLKLLGHGLVENPDEMDGEPWDTDLLDWLASDFAENKYDMRRLIAQIVSSQTYQMPSVPATANAAGGYVFRGPELRRLTAEQFADAVGAITGDWHVYNPPADPLPKPPVAPGTPPKPEPESAFLPAPLIAPKPGVYTREWRVAGSSLTRALGRPIRDQVFSTRDNQPTTLQALELVNGETLTHWLNRGALKMLGELPDEPASIYDRSMKDRGFGSFEADISGAEKIWLLVSDSGTYSPERVEAIWANVELEGPDGVVSLESLKPLSDEGLRPVSTPIEVPGSNGVGFRVKTPSQLVFDLGGKKYKTMRGIVALENKELNHEISPSIRFFVFKTEPNKERLSAVGPDVPRETNAVTKSPAKIPDHLFLYGLDRKPSAKEKTLAIGALKDPSHPKQASADNLADFLWALMMKPEFQLIY